VSAEVKALWALGILALGMFMLAVSYKWADDMRSACMARTCSAGFPAWSYGPDRVNPISGKSIGRGSDSACYCVVIAGDEPK